MWRSLHLTQKTDSALAASITDLLQSTSRTLIVTVGVGYIVWTLAVTVFLFDRPVGIMAWRTLPVFVPAWLVALRLIQRSLATAQVVWQLGLVATITLAIFFFQQPEIAFFYSLLPLFAVVMVNAVAGCLVEGFLILLVWWLVRSPTMTLLPDSYISIIPMLGAITLILGWIVTQSLITVTHWSLFSLRQARQSMDEAQTHRAELMQTQKSLQNAHYQLDRTNAALVAAWRSAEEATHFKTKFINTVSHELRTPLNLIVGFSEMIMTAPESYDGVLLPNVYRGDMNAIYRSAQHLLALVDDILDLGRIETGRMTVVRETVDLAAVVTEAVGLVHDYIHTKGLELQVQISADLPEVCGDSLRIRQALLNLLVNASRFTDQGWIQVTAEQQGKEVVVSVTDTGRGIPEQELSKIFEEFHTRDQPVSQWHSGTGLGLSISKKIITLHHGRMGVESTVGRGTTIWFTLPGPTMETEVHQQPAASRSLPLMQLRSTEPVIVVVHEESRVAPALQRYLTDYQILWAENLEAGLAMAKEVKAVAVVTENTQTESSGTPASEPPPLPDNDCLLVRCPLPSGRWAALMLGVKEVLAKPVSRQTLLTAVKRLEKPVRQVLIVDDNPEVVELFERMLKSHPVIEQCFPAYGGQEALRLAGTKRPDLILLDLMMPDMDGQAVLERLAADPDLAAIPVIVASAEVPHQFSSQPTGSIHVFKTGSFLLSEVAETLAATFKALNPEWHQLDATVSELAGGTAG